MSSAQPLQLVTYDNDPTNILHENLSTRAEDPKEVAHYHKLMSALCKQHGGLGLAANQAGIRHNIFFVSADARISKNIIGELCINPRFTPEPMAARVTHREGCLSIPGGLFKVDRYAVIIAEWCNVAGHQKKERLRGIAAQVFQHEHDHLCGITLLESGEVTVVTPAK